MCACFEHCGICKRPIRCTANARTNVAVLLKRVWILVCGIKIEVDPSRPPTGVFRKRAKLNVIYFCKRNRPT